MKKLIIVSLLSVFALGTFGQTAAIHQILDKMSEEGLFFTNEIRSLLEKGIDTKGKYGRSPLNVAAMYHCTDLGKADNDGRTPLHHAACCRKPECMELLLEAGGKATGTLKLVTGIAMLLIFGKIIGILY